MYFLSSGLILDFFRGNFKKKKNYEDQEGGGEKRT